MRRWGQTYTDYIDRAEDRVDLDLKLTSDSLIDFSGKKLEICKVRFDNGSSTYNSIERMALKESRSTILPGFIVTSPALR